MQSKSPAAAVIERLGVRPLARELGLTPGAVSKWQRKGLVPAKYHIAILAIARKRRKRLNATILVHGA